MDIIFEERFDNTDPLNNFRRIERTEHLAPEPAVLKNWNPTHVAIGILSFLFLSTIGFYCVKSISTQSQVSVPAGTQEVRHGTRESGFEASQRGDANLRRSKQSESDDRNCLDDFGRCGDSECYLIFIRRLIPQSNEHAAKEPSQD